MNNDNDIASLHNKEEVLLHAIGEVVNETDSPTLDT